MYVLFTLRHPRYKPQIGPFEMQSADPWFIHSVSFLPTADSVAES